MSAPHTALEQGTPAVLLATRLLPAAALCARPDVSLALALSRLPLAVLGSIEGADMGGAAAVETVPGEPIVRVTYGSGEVGYLATGPLECLSCHGQGGDHWDEYGVEGRLLRERAETCSRCDGRRVESIEPGEECSDYMRAAGMLREVA